MEQAFRLTPPESELTLSPPPLLSRAADLDRAPFVSRWFGLIVLATLLVPGHLAGYLVERVTVASLVLLLGIALVANGWRGVLPRVYAGLSAKALTATMWVVGFLYVLATIFHQEGAAQWFEILRFPVYGALLLLLLLGNHLPTTKSVKRATKCTVAYSVAVLLLLRVTVPVLSPLATSIYESTKMRWSTDSGTRFSAPFENPNYLAFFLIVSIAYLIALEADDVLSTRLTILAAVALLVLTGSRAGYIAGAALGASLLGMRVLQWVWFRPRSIRVQRPAARTVMLIGGLAAIVFLAPLARQLQSPRFEAIQEIAASTSPLSRSISASTDESITARLDNWRMTLEDVEGSPLVGVGAWETRVVDNQFLIWASRVGMVGLLLVLTVWSSLVLAANKGDFVRGRPMTVWAIIVPTSVMISTGAFLSNFRLFFFFAAVLLSLAVADRSLTRDGAPTS